MSPTRKRRPRQEDAASQLATLSLAPLTQPLDDIARHVDGTFVVVVATTGGQYRRRCFLTCAAAERAARRAQEAGHEATAYLAELRPLWQLQPGQTT